MNISAVRSESELTLASLGATKAAKAGKAEIAVANAAAEEAGVGARRTDVVSLSAENTPAPLYAKPPITPPPAGSGTSASTGAGSAGEAQAPTPAAQPAPIADGVTFGQQDLDSLLSAFGSRQGDGQFNSAFDFNGDGAVDFDDLNRLLSNFVPAPPAAPAQQAPPASQPTNPAPAIAIGAEPEAIAPAAPEAAPAPVAITAPAAATPETKETTDGVTFLQGDLPAFLFSYGRSAGEAGFEARFDFNADGVIGFDDLNTALSNISPGAAQHASTLEGLVNAFGLNQGQEGFDARFDIDADGFIGFADLNQLLSDLFVQS